jgi:riboflavin synthase
VFTGIVTALGTVEKIERKDQLLELTISAPFEDLADGESVAVNGACLTVVAHNGGRFRVQAIASTQDRTRFGEMRAGGRVNLERALRLADRLGGHFVQGHVDGLAEVTGVNESRDALLVDLRVPGEVASVTVPMGSITLDGVSLTVNAIPQRGTVQVSLIPYTREHTTLGLLRVGDTVHVEGDMIGKMVAQFVKQAKER